jgi:hypothetical protein
MFGYYPLVPIELASEGFVFPGCRISGRFYKSIPHKDTNPERYPSHYYKVI